MCICVCTLVVCKVRVFILNKNIVNFHLTLLARCRTICIATSKGVSGNFPTVFQIICYISQNRINTNWIQTFIVLSIQEVWKRKLSVAFCTSVCVEYLCANKLHTLYVHTCVEREISLFSFL